MDTTSKKILSLDGGGIKGALTLGLLKKFEEHLQEINDKNYRLKDYFDLIGGTSTGAIIATGLARGMTVDELKTKYFNLGEKVFKKRRILSFLFGPGSFAAKNIRRELKIVFGDMKMESPELKKGGLAIFTKRMDTQSLWPIFNNPKFKYWKYQKEYLVREVVRASTAAPTYFESEEVDVKNSGESKDIGQFVDGGLSVANNPALNLYFLVSLPGYAYNWKSGKDNLIIYSFGTGRSISPNIPRGLIKPLGWAKKAPQILMEDISEQNEILLQLLSHSNRRYFDRVLEDLDGIRLTKQPLLDYYRYNVDFTSDYFDKIDYPVNEKKLKKLRRMDNPEFVTELFDIGYKASTQIKVGDIR